MTYPKRDETVVVTPSIPVRRVSWGAVFAGALLGLMTLVVLNLLTLGIGLQTINPADEADPLAGLGTGLTITTIIITLLAFFIGGWVAGRLAGFARRTTGVLHGLLTWGVLTLVSFMFLSSAAGRLISGVTGAVSQGLSLLGQGVGALAPGAAQAVEDALSAQGVNLDTIGQEVQQLVQQVTEGEAGAEAEQVAGEAEEAVSTIATNPQQATSEINGLIQQLLASGEDVANETTEQDLVTALVQNTDLTEAEAQATVDNWQQVAEDAQATLDSAQQTLEEVAQTAATVVGQAAVWAFIGLLIGAIIAAIGAVVGSPRGDRAVYRS